VASVGLVTSFLCQRVGEPYVPWSSGPALQFFQEKLWRVFSLRICRLKPWGATGSLYLYVSRSSETLFSCVCCIFICIWG